MLKKALAAATLTTTLMAGTTPAWAHVTVEPASVPQGAGDEVLTFRVPNESPSASVVALRIEFPTDHPIAVVSPQTGSGWKVTMKHAPLNPPVRTDDGTFTSTVSEIDWTGGSIPVGQFGSFEVLAQGLPTGVSQLAFPAIQLYGDGTTVSWIDVPNSAVPDPSHPAPILELTAGAPTSATTAATAGTPTAVATPSTGRGSNALEVTALILSGLALVIALLAVWLGRPIRPS
jgi:uncharacterized protein YcnI